jgi:hypothetical protein
MFAQDVGIIKLNIGKLGTDEKRNGSLLFIINARSVNGLGMNSYNSPLR